MTIKNLAKLATILGLIGFAVFWVLTIPQKHDVTEYSRLKGDPTKGALVFAASGCASCHAPSDASGEARLILTGGRAFASDFGTFYAPNISSDREFGIGSWSLPEFADALRFGTSPEGKHYYPAFPYGTYQNMEPADIADLFAFFKTIPASATPSKPHDVSFPFSMRRGLGLWKLAFMPSGFVLEEDGLNDTELRGRYLVEAMGHCAECHTPRNIVGGLRGDRWLSGAPNPDGKGKIPNITPHEQGIKNWEEIDIVTYLNSGFTPEYDSAGSTMAEVVENMKQLPETDLKAIAAYLKKIPALAKP